MCNTQTSVASRESEEVPTVGPTGSAETAVSLAQLERPQQQRKSHSRRVNKPLMERKRRERINSCLEELKTLVLKAQSKDPSRYSKLEKADILEMTVRHVQSLHRHDLSRRNVSGDENAGKYRAGFSQCAAEVTKFLAGVKGMPHDVHVRLLQHIQSVASHSPRAPDAPGTARLPRMSVQQMTTEPVTVTTVTVPEDTKTPEKMSSTRPAPLPLKSRRPTESMQCSKKRLIASSSHVVPQSPPKSPPNSVTPTSSSRSQIVRCSPAAQPLKKLPSQQIQPTTTTSPSGNEPFVHNPTRSSNLVAGSPPPLVTPSFQKVSFFPTRMTSGELALLVAPESSTPPGMVTPPGSPQGVTLSPKQSWTSIYHVPSKAGSYCKQYARSEGELPKIQKPSCSVNSLGYPYLPHGSQGQWHQANTRQLPTLPRRPIPISTSTPHWRPW